MYTYRQEMAVKCVKMCRNGDSFFPPVNVVVNPRDIRNMDAFLDRVTQVTRMRNAARRVCTPRKGHKIEDLNKLISGGVYVAVGQEGFKMLEYGDIHIRKPAKHRNEIKIEPVKHSRILMSARCRKVALWESSGLKTIYVYRNGDDKQPSHKILLDRRTLLNMDKVLEQITERVKLESGAVLRLYTLDAKEIHSTSELVNGEKYVAVGHGKRFKRTAYNDNQKVSPSNSPRRPKVKHRIFMQKRGHLSPTGGEVKPEKKILTERGAGNEMQGTLSLSKEASITASQQDNQKQEANVEKEENNTTSKQSNQLQQSEAPLDKTIVGLGDYGDDQDDVYKASGARSEKAKPVEDDREVKVEKPIDQVAAEEVVEELVDGDVEDKNDVTELPEQQVEPLTVNDNETVEENTSN